MQKLGQSQEKIIEQMEGLCRLGHRVQLFAGKASELYCKACDQGFEVTGVSWKSKDLYATGKLLRSAILKDQVQIVQSFSEWDSWIAGLLSLTTKAQMIRVLPFQEKVIKNHRYIPLYKKIINTLVVPSPFVKQNLLKDWKDIFVVPRIGLPIKNPLQSLEKQTRKKLGVPKQTFLIGAVSTVDSRVSREFIAQTASLLKAHQRVRWVVAGTARGWDAIIASYGLQGRVICTGEGQIESILQLSDATVFFSQSATEVSPVLCRAAAMEKPLVAEAIPGYVEVCSHLQTALLANPGNCKKLAESVLQLMDDTRLCRQLGMAARKRVQQHFTESAIMDRLVRGYQKILQK